MAPNRDILDKKINNTTIDSQYIAVKYDAIVITAQQ